MTNPNVYPITAKFEEFAKKLLRIDVLENKNYHPLLDLDMAIAMKEIIGEYEHGTANPEDVFGNVEGLDLSEIYDAGERNRLCLRLYVKVCEDLLLTLINGE